MLCRMNGSDVHEIVPRSKGKASLVESNMVFLCRSCHRTLHDVPVDDQWLLDKRREYLNVFVN